MGLRGYKGRVGLFVCKLHSFIPVPCDQIERETDESTKETTAHTPFTQLGRVAPMIMYKQSDDDRKLFVLSLTTVGQTHHLGKKGVMIVLTDSTRWERKPTPIRVDQDAGGYQYSAHLAMTDEDIALFSERTIDKFRLFIYDRDVTDPEAETFAEQVGCLVER